MADNYTLQVLVRYNRLPEIMAKLPVGADRALEAGAYAIQAYAKANHPWQNQTGETEASIEAERLGEMHYVVHFGGASKYLEWGTVKMPPFPFIQPAFDAVKPKIEDMFSGLEALL